MRRMGLSMAIAAVAAFAQPAGAQDTRLAGTNEISGSRSGYVDVVLAEAARLNFAFAAKENETFRIAGGRYAAVVLRGLDGARSVVAAARFAPDVICDECDTAHETLSVGFANIEAQASVDRRFEIPAGRYRMYLFTDGTPARAVVRVDELSGTLKLVPEWGARPPVFRALALQAPGFANAAVYSGADRLDGQGLVVAGGLAVGGDIGNVEINGCLHEGEGETPGAFAPPCPGGTHTGSHGFTYVVAEGEHMWGAGFLSEVEGGTWAAGGSILGADVITATGWASSWLSYAGDGVRLTASPVVSAAGPLTGTSPAAAAPPAAESSAAVLRTRRARVRRGRVALVLGCTAGPCAGTLRVAGARPMSVKGPGTVRVKVPAAVARKLRRSRRATLKVRLDGRAYAVALRR